jgi:hypothetical protein
MKLKGYLCGLGNTFTEDFDFDVTEVGVQSDGHVGENWFEISASFSG